MKIANVILRVRDKNTHRTWRVAYPFGDCVGYMVTGTKRLVQFKAGYGERNEYGEDVLDSWVEPFGIFAGLFDFDTDAIGQIL